MQGQKSFKTLIILQFTVVALVGCTNKNEDFAPLIAKHEGTSLTRLPEIIEGLPFYAPKTLSPFWPKENDKAPLVSIPEFQLTNQNNEKVTETLFKGKNTVVGFLFTSCAGFCPTLLRKMKEIKTKVNSSKFQYVVFSVDPEVDTPKVLKNYMKKHRVSGDNWTFITGRKEIIHGLIRDTFASEVRRLESDSMRKFAHTEHFYLLDEQSRLRAVLNGTRIDLPKKMMNIVGQL